MESMSHPLFHINYQLFKFQTKDEQQQQQQQ